MSDFLRADRLSCMAVALLIGSVISTFWDLILFFQILGIYSGSLCSLHYVMPSFESLDCWFLTLPSLALVGESLMAAKFLSLTHLCLFLSGLAPSRWIKSSMVIALYWLFLMSLFKWATRENSCFCGKRVLSLVFFFLKRIISNFMLWHTHSFNSYWSNFAF